MSKGDIRHLVLGVVVILALIITISSFSWDDSNSNSLDSIPRMEQDEEFTLEDMTTFVEDDFTKEEDIGVDSKLNITELLKQKIAERNGVNESDSEILLKELLDQDRENEKKAALAIQSSSVVEKKLSYDELLEIERAAIDKAYEDDYYKEEEEEQETEKITFRAAVYQTQFVIPGQRLDLMTTQEFIYNKMRFKKGMRFYAVVDINESRVMLDINNIAHIPLSVEVRDVADGRIGLYSERAVELWGIYQQRLKEEANEDITSELSNAVSLPVISSSIEVLGNFFASKKGKKAKRIKIDNDSQFILTIL